MKKYARLDQNHPEIVDSLRRVGFSVQSLATVGCGCPDIIVGTGGQNYLFEIKDGDKVPSKRKLTPDEMGWHAAWKGQVHTVMSVQDCLDVITGGKK
jgi:Holliday junction resolvase